MWETKMPELSLLSQLDALIVKRRKSQVSIERKLIQYQYPVQFSKS